jgi:hypothetical protein
MIKKPVYVERDNPIVKCDVFRCSTHLISTYRSAIVVKGSPSHGEGDFSFQQPFGREEEPEVKSPRSVALSPLIMFWAGLLCKSWIWLIVEEIFEVLCVSIYDLKTLKKYQSESGGAFNAVVGNAFASKYHSIFYFDLDG